jgi:hypothetical protein
MSNQTIVPKAGSLNLTANPVQLRVLSNFRLNPTRPFYQFVLTYLAASAGLTPVYDAKGYPDFLQNIIGVFPGVTGDDAQVNLAECIKLARDGLLPQRNAEQSLCCMLANSAYESVNQSERNRLKGNPIFEVFRHVRNAASHGNAWYFDKKQPSFHGAWKRIVIDETQMGSRNPLHGKTCFYGTIQPADLLYLLQDVEGLLI